MREQHNLPGNQNDCRKILYWAFICSLIYSFNKSLLSLGFISGSVLNAGNSNEQVRCFLVLSSLQGSGIVQRLTEHLTIIQL